MPARTKTGEPLVGAGELSEQIGQPPSTIRLWTQKGYLPAYRMPGSRTRYLYRVSDVLRAIEEHRVTPEAS